MFWMMNGRNRRGGGGLFLLPGLLFGGFFGIYVILALLNVAVIVIGAVFSGLAAAFSGILGAVGSGIGTAGSVIVGIVIGYVLFTRLKNRIAQNRAEEE